MATTTTTAMQPSQDASDFYHAAENLIHDLAGRWIDESRYEDILDYGIVIQKLADRFGIMIMKMTKRPFGCVFAVRDGRHYKLSITSRKYQYKRIV